MILSCSSPHFSLLYLFSYLFPYLFSFSFSLSLHKFLRIPVKFLDLKKIKICTISKWLVTQWFNCLRHLKVHWVFHQINIPDTELCYWQNQNSIKILVNDNSKTAHFEFRTILLKKIINFWSLFERCKRVKDNALTILTVKLEITPIYRNFFIYSKIKIYCFTNLPLYNRKLELNSLYLINPIAKFRWCYLCIWHGRYNKEVRNT